MLSTVGQFWNVLKYLRVPGTVIDQIKCRKLGEVEEKVEGLRYYLETVPGASWGRIAGALWFAEEHEALKSITAIVQQMRGM